MTKQEKEIFVRDLIGLVQADILAKVSQMPEDWDGHELRRYIADKFEQSVMTVGRSGHYGKPYAKRFRDYKNEIAIRNL